MQHRWVEQAQPYSPSRWRKRLALLAAGVLAMVAACQAAERPAVLVCSPDGAWQGRVDLTWMRELHEARFEPDYLDRHQDFTWERVRQYNCLVLYGCPAEKEERAFPFPAAGPRLKEYVEIVERFLAAGGGVYLMVETDNADQHVKPLIEPWGARLPFEIYVEEDPAKIVTLPRMPGQGSLALVDQVVASPITEGVRNLWLPYGQRYNTSWTAPIDVSADWQVVVKGSKTSRTRPVDPTMNTYSIPAPPQALVRPDGVPEPALVAIRSYRNGRLVLLCQGPVFTIGQGTQWLFDRHALSRGLNGIPSDFGRLVSNALGWLAAPSLASGAVGGYQASPQRLLPPNYQPGVKADFELKWWSDEELDRHRPPRSGKIYRGLIGAQTAFSAGAGTVAEFAAAARKAGLDFVAFMEQFTDLTQEEFAQLQAECRRLSDDSLLLLPGYTIDTNIGNHMFFTGYDLPWPRDNCLVGADRKTLMIQFQNEQGQFVFGPNTFLQWVLYGHERYKGQMVGYYLFDDPRAMQIPDLKLSSAVAVKTYRGGKLIDSRTEEYLLSTAGTLPSLPVAVSVVRSPAELAAEAASGHALTFAQGTSLKTLAPETLRWNSQYDGLNVFASNGPMIRAWPHCYRATTYGAEPFVVNRELMPSELHITSEVGLREITVTNGDKLVRRFLPAGAKEFREILHLPGHVQQNLVVIAHDVQGGEAISSALRCWRSGSLGIEFCGDHVNDCGRQYLARGMGTFVTHRFPVFPAGWTWDGGPKGVRPVLLFNGNHPSIVSNLGEEGGKGFNNIPIQEFNDDQAIVVRSVLREVYDPAVTPVNAWYTSGPKGPSALIECVRRYTEFNQPLVGPEPTGWAAQSVRSGAVLASFSATIRFKQRQTVQKLQLLRTDWVKNVPATLVAGAGDAQQTHALGDGGKGFVIPIGTGEWFGIHAGETHNQVLFLNRGAPLLLQNLSDNKGGFCVMVLADLAGKTVQAGDELHCELFSVNEPLDCPESGVERFHRVLAFLAQPDGLEILSGKPIPSLGFFDVQATSVGGTVELRLPRPAQRLGLTVPVRVLGLNPRWSAGLFQIQGHSTGHYTNGQNVYTTLGFDFDGRVYAALYPDQSEETHVVIGHPLVCDHPELVLEVMPRLNEQGQYLWHVAVNNPTDQPVTATFRQGMKLPGLAFADRTHTIPAGGYVALGEP